MRATRIGTKRGVRVSWALFTAALIAAFVMGMSVSAAADLKLPTSPIGTAPITVRRITANVVRVPTPQPRPQARRPSASVPKAPPRVAGASVWDRLAQCESGGNWQTNTGNGYSGGLQFSASTWRSAGGTRYAPSAHQASRDQQIAVADAWLKKTSWSQWPACSRRLGLR